MAVVREAREHARVRLAEKLLRFLDLIPNPQRKFGSMPFGQSGSLVGPDPRKYGPVASALGDRARLYVRNLPKGTGEP